MKPETLVPVFVAALCLGATGCNPASDMKCPDQGTVQKEFFEDTGTTQYYCLRWDGLRHGPFRAYDREGRLTYTGSNRENDWDGVVTGYAKDGSIISRTVYRKGIPVRWEIENGEPVRN